MIAWVTAVQYAVLVLALGLSMLRVAKGPTVADRAVALDVASSVLVGLIVLTALRQEEHFLVDIALGVALIAFLGIVAVARFLAGTPTR